MRELTDGDAVLAPVVDAMLGVRRELLQHLDDLHRLLLATVRTDPVCGRLMSVPGVGPVTALAFRTAIEDPSRFAKSSLVGSYFGLTPRKYAFGETDRNGSISLCGDKMVRSLLCEAGQCAAHASAALELAQAVGRRSRPPAGAYAGPGGGRASARGDHASDVGRRHLLPLDAGWRLPRRLRHSLKESAHRRDIRDPLRRMRPAGCRARQYRQTFCAAASLSWRRARSQRLMCRPFLAHLAAVWRRPRSEE